MQKYFFIKTFIGIDIPNTLKTIFWHKTVFCLSSTLTRQHPLFLKIKSGGGSSCFYAYFRLGQVKLRRSLSRNVMIVDMIGKNQSLPLFLKPNWSTPIQKSLIIVYKKQWYLGYKRVLKYMEGVLITTQGQTVQQVQRLQITIIADNQLPLLITRPLSGSPNYAWY